jgi:hypothetical protein
MVNKCGGYSDVQLAVMVACLDIVADNWPTMWLVVHILVYNWYNSFTTGLKLV